MEEAAVLTGTHDYQEIIERVAALDIGKAELMCCGCRMRTGRAGGCRKCRRIRR
jgi:hypothetical protein